MAAEANDAADAADAADVTGDGADDVLVTNGGDHLAPASSSRDPGYVMVLDGETGAVVQQLTVPDGQETYVGLTFWERPEGAYAVFGTGGEDSERAAHVLGEARSHAFRAAEDGYRLKRGEAVQAVSASQLAVEVMRACGK